MQLYVNAKKLNNFLSPNLTEKANICEPTKYSLKLYNFFDKIFRLIQANKTMCIIEFESEKLSTYSQPY